MAEQGRSKRYRKWLMGLLMLGVIVLVLALLLRPQPLQVESDLVTLRELVVSVREQGRTRARQPYTITAPVAGQLLRTPLREGDTVNAGQIIARIAVAPEDQRSEAVLRANLDAAHARSTAARAGLEEAISLRERAARESLRRQQLFEEGVIGEEERDSYQQALAAAESREAAARSSLAAAEAEVSSARSRLLGTHDTAESVLELQAPVAGTIYQVHEKDERVVQAGAPLFLLSDGDSLELVIDLLTQQAVQVRPGDRIMISGWGGEETLEGQVRYIEPEAFTKFSALGVEEQRVNVIGELLEENTALGAEYRIEAAIVTWQQPDVLTVATSALFRRDGNWHVFAIADGRAVLRELRLGQRSQNYAEVLQGLQDQERVIVFPSDQVREGLAVAD